MTIPEMVYQSYVAVFASYVRAEKFRHKSVNDFEMANLAEIAHSRAEKLFLQFFSREERLKAEKEASVFARDNQVYGLLVS